MDRETRKIMTKHRSLHPNASIQRIYLPRKAGGRGLLSGEDLYNRIFVKNHEDTGIGAHLYGAATGAAKVHHLIFEPISQRPHKEDLRTLEQTKLKQKLKDQINRNLMLAHMEKAMHSQFYKSMEEQNLSRELTFAFLNAPGLYSETEGYIMACQDGVYGSLVYRKLVMKQPLQDTRCRANEEKNPPYTPGDIPAVVQNENGKIFWNFAFLTTADITANEPDMLVLDKLRKTIFVIEMFCPSEGNIQSKKLEKTKKYLLFQLKHTYPGYKSSIFIPSLPYLYRGLRSHHKKHRTPDGKICYLGLTKDPESPQYQPPTNLGPGYYGGISHGNGMHPERHRGYSHFASCEDFAYYTFA
ncbi:hypothetical protein QE152_g38320 [Popillia japonica]|uniref:Uncharacterized protein n=1 Tax=Popillia japonica TaxID=7064 RepID=A0AAW1I844_POPJA